MKTWHIEIAFVACALAATTSATHGDWRAWIACAAVVCTFAHAQIADRLAEREASRARPLVECHHKAARFFVAKEALWVVFFVATDAYPALAGCALFLAYPVWRRFWRRTHPLDRKARS